MGYNKGDVVKLNELGIEQAKPNERARTYRWVVSESVPDNKHWVGLQGKLGVRTIERSGGHGCWGFIEPSIVELA